MDLEGYFNDSERKDSLVPKNYEIKSLDDLKIEISKKMRKDRFYYHCISCGGIYEDKNKSLKIMELKATFGFNFLPPVFDEYKVSSGMCGNCMSERKDKRANSYSYF